MEALIREIARRGGKFSQPLSEILDEGLKVTKPPPSMYGAMVAEAQQPAPTWAGAVGIAGVKDLSRDDLKP
jgi:hypothetical protein